MCRELGGSSEKQEANGRPPPSQALPPRNQGSWKVTAEQPGLGVHTEPPTCKRASRAVRTCCRDTPAGTGRCHLWDSSRVTPEATASHKPVRHRHALAHGGRWGRGSFQDKALYKEGGAGLKRHYWTVFKARITVEGRLVEKAMYSLPQYLPLPQHTHSSPVPRGEGDLKAENLAALPSHRPRYRDTRCLSIRCSRKKILGRSCPARKP